MKRYFWMPCLVLFVGFVSFPWQVFAASITENSAAIGKDCTANLHSTAMGFNSTASGLYSTAIGYSCVAGGAFSWAGGNYMRLKDTAYGSFVWGYAPYGAADLEEPNVFLIFPVGDPGKVGIGTPEPESKLDIKGAADELVLSRLNQIGNKNWCGWRLDRNTSEKWFIGMGNNNDNLVFRGAASKNYIVIENGGQVGICTDAPIFNLHVNGTAGKPHGGTWEDASDERLKTNIKALESKEALDKITHLRGVTFEWINTEEHAKGLRAGILAQELEVVFPEWVEEVEPSGRDKELIPHGEKAKAISFPHDFNAYLIEAIKELKAQNERQQTEIEELRSMIKELTSDHQQIAKR